MLKQDLNTSIWMASDTEHLIRVIDQRYLPFEVRTIELKSFDDAYFAIKEMIVRGAPLIGVTAVYGMYLSVCEFIDNDFENQIRQKAEYLKSARPTAVNLACVVDEMLCFILKNSGMRDLKELTREKANAIRQNEIDFSNRIGENGLGLIEEIYLRERRTINILTHCNAGWLAYME